MIITCLNCSTQFDIPDSEYRPGRKARCSQCRTIFSLPEPNDTGEGAGGESGSIEEPAGSVSEPTSDVVAETAGTGAFVSLPEAVDDGAFEPDVPKESSRKGKSNVFIVVALVLLVCIFAAGGFLAFRMLTRSPGAHAPHVASDPSVKIALGGEKQLTPEERAKEEARQATVRNLALLDVRQYTVTENNRTGRMVIVEGKVANNFETPKDLILLEITLFDKNGNPLIIREQYCGVTLSILQLRTLSKAAIEAALSDQTVILNNNTDIPPKGQVPFITVFFNLPAQAYEFEVKIADVKDTAQAPAPK